MIYVAAVNYLFFKNILLCGTRLCNDSPGFVNRVTIAKGKVKVRNMGERGSNNNGNYTLQLIIAAITKVSDSELEWINDTTSKRRVTTQRFELRQWRKSAPKLYICIAVRFRERKTKAFKEDNSKPEASNSSHGSSSMMPLVYSMHCIMILLLISKWTDLNSAGAPRHFADAYP